MHSQQPAFPVEGIRAQPARNASIGSIRDARHAGM
jgi:hypothetical protein